MQAGVAPLPQWCAMRAGPRWAGNRPHAPPLFNNSGLDRYYVGKASQRHRHDTGTVDMRPGVPRLRTSGVYQGEVPGKLMEKSPGTISLVLSCWYRHSNNCLQWYSSCRTSTRAKTRQDDHQLVYQVRLLVLLLANAGASALGLVFSLFFPRQALEMRLWPLRIHKHLGEGRIAVHGCCNQAQQLHELITVFRERQVVEHGPQEWTPSSFVQYACSVIGADLPTTHSVASLLLAIHSRSTTYHITPSQLRADTVLFTGLSLLHALNEIKRWLVFTWSRSFLIPVVVIFLLNHSLHECLTNNVPT